MKQFVRTFACLGIAALISGCASQEVVAPTAVPQPTPTTEPMLIQSIEPAEPTAIVTETVATPAVSASDEPILPASLYAIINGQISLIDQTGKTKQLTNEPAPGEALAVIGVAVSPADNSLAYLTQTEGGTSLIHTNADGSDRSVWIERKNVNISGPRWSPDGKQLVVAMTEYDDAGTIKSGGLYLLAADGGEPKLLQANGPTTVMTETLDPNAVGYSPLTFSADGSKLLVARYSTQVEQCQLAIINLAGGEPLLVDSPEESLRPSCGPAFWSADGSVVYTSFQPKDGVYAASAGLWKVDPATGAVSPVVPAKTNGKNLVIVNPVAAPDGSILAFVAEVTTMPQIGTGVEIPYTMARINPADGTWKALRTETFVDGDGGAWAPDRSGVLIVGISDQGKNNLTWTPIDGSPARVVATGIDLNGIAWSR